MTATKTKDLPALAERCEKATGPDRELDAAIQCAFPDKAPHFSGVGVCNAFTASLDAAMTLVPEGWEFGVGTEGGQGCAFLNRGSEFCHDYFAATPALALCAAALRAMEASNGKGDNP